jgi:hypothetical protein
MIRKLTIILLCTSLYTITRYAIFGKVSPTHMPVYLLNKSISMASVYFLFCAALNHAKGLAEKSRFWGMASLHGTYIHIALSLSILSNAYYPKLFGTEKMNLTGELTVLLGILSIYCFWCIRKTNLDPVFTLHRKLRILSSILVAGHLLTLWFSGFLNEEKWPGGLPPISLISLVFAIISLVIFLKRDENTG